MKIFITRLVVVSITFAIGIYAVWFSMSKSHQENSNKAIEVNQTKFTPQVAPTYQQPQIEITTQPESKPENKKPIPFKKHENFENAVLALKRLIPFMDKSGEQTFLISDVRVDNGEYAYAYWKQDNSIIILHFPFDGEPDKSKLYWLRDKARIDLNNVVPTGKYENLGCCMVEKDWADKVLSWCKKGYKLKIVGEKNKSQ